MRATILATTTLALLVGGSPAHALPTTNGVDRHHVHGSWHAGQWRHLSASPVSGSVSPRVVARKGKRSRVAVRRSSVAARLTPPIAKTPLAEFATAVEFAAVAPVMAAGNLFRRFAESLEVVVQPWVRMTCAGGLTLPRSLQAMLDEATAHFGGKVLVNSAYRDVTYNARVGGARNSQHIQCLAVDFRVDGVSPAALGDWVLRNRQRFGVNGIGTYHRHVHADARRSRTLVTWGGLGRNRHAARIVAKRGKPQRTRYAGAQG